MKGTRLQTMASVLVTLAAPAAYAVVSHPSENKVVQKHKSQESFSAWQIPQPGQTLGRMTSGSPLRESVGILGTVETVDPITQAPKSRFGRIPLSLHEAFGSQKSYERWLASAGKSANSRTAFAQHIEKHLRHFVATHKSELAVDGLKLSWDAQRFYFDAEHTFASFYLTAADTLVEGAELTFRFSEGQLTNIVSKTFGAGSAQLNAIRVEKNRAAEAARAILGPSAQLDEATVT